MLMESTKKKHVLLKDEVSYWLQIRTTSSLDVNGKRNKKKGFCR